MFVIDTLLLQPGKNEFNVELAPDVFDIDPDELQLLTPVQVNMTIEKVEDEFVCLGTFKTSGRYACSRCLAEIETTIEESFEMFFRRQESAYLPQDMELSVEDTLEYFYSGKDIDFGEHLRELLILTVPIKVLCQEDCKGLCSHCGQNLNEGTCSCKNEQIDPRWEKLRELYNK